MDDSINIIKRINDYTIKLNSRKLILDSALYNWAWVKITIIPLELGNKYGFLKEVSDCLPIRPEYWNSMLESWQNAKLNIDTQKGAISHSRWSRKDAASRNH